MNCKLCGYYYSSHEHGSTCQHCGGNRNGLHKTKLMTVSKMIVVIAYIILAFMCTKMFHEYIRDMYAQQYYSDDSGGTYWNMLIYFSCLLCFLFSFPVIFRIKRCNFGNYIASAISIFPAAAITSGETVPFLITAVPCLLFIISAVTALIDKKNQVKEYENKRC